MASVPSPSSMELHARTRNGSPAHTFAFDPREGSLSNFPGRRVVHPSPRERWRCSRARASPDYRLDPAARRA